MKKVSFKSLKHLLPLLCFTIMCTSACTQNDQSTVKDVPSEKLEKISAPKMDIHMAVISGDLAAVKQHIQAGTDINQKEAMAGSTPIMTAATFNQPAIAKELIKAKADLTIKNNDGSTVLHTAAFFGRIEIVKLLIDAQADKTIKNNFGATPRETVVGDFSEVKPFYEMLILQLKPMGFTLDLEELQKARPVVAMMLND